MRSEIEPISVLYGTVNDLLNVYPFVNSDMKKRLWAAIAGRRILSEEIRLQMDSENEATELRTLSKMAEGPINTLQVRSQSRPDQTHTLTFLGGVPIACSCESYRYAETKTACKHLKEAALRDFGAQFKTTAE